MQVTKWLNEPHISWHSKNQFNYWGRATYISVSKLTIIGSDDGLSPGRHKAIVWTNAGILYNWSPRNNFNWNWYIFIKKMHLKMSSGKRWPFCLGLNVLTHLSLSQLSWSPPPEKQKEGFAIHICISREMRAVFTIYIHVYATLDQDGLIRSSWILQCNCCLCMCKAWALGSFEYKSILDDFYAFTNSFQTLKDKPFTTRFLLLC